MENGSLAPLLAKVGEGAVDPYGAVLQVLEDPTLLDAILGGVPARGGE